MDAEELQGLIGDLVYDHGQDTGVQIDVETFETAGVLTTNAGLVVDFPNGEQYQITIVRSR